MASPIRYCEVDGCENRRFGNGYCNKHYKQVQRYGHEFLDPKVEREFERNNCSFDKCLRKSYSKGYCTTHYARMRYRAKAGIGSDLKLEENISPGYGRITKATDSEDWTEVSRLIASFFRERTGEECWDWPTVTTNGYPRIGTSRDSKVVNYAVHRMSMEAKLGRKLQAKMTVHHTCHNRACVNPNHLQEVTSRENLAEMKARRFFENRIRLLEEALATFDPYHPLLTEQES